MKIIRPVTRYIESAEIESNIIIDEEAWYLSPIFGILAVLVIAVGILIVMLLKDVQHEKEEGERSGT